MMAFRPFIQSTFAIRSLCRHTTKLKTVRALSSTLKAPDADLETLLSHPSWSVKSLFDSATPSSAPPVTKEQLHHLLRLSALPLPTSAAQEEKMIADLQSQLKFVQAIQSVDTTGVEPLRSIRDETKEAEMENEITLATLQVEFDEEEVVGMRGRIRRRKDLPDPEREEEVKDWNPLEQASKKLGGFFVVDTAKD